MLGGDDDITVAAARQYDDIVSKGKRCGRNGMRVISIYYMKQTTAGICCNCRMWLISRFVSLLWFSAGALNEPRPSGQFSPQPDESTLRKPYSIQQLSHSIYDQLPA